MAKLGTVQQFGQQFNSTSVWGLGEIRFLKQKFKYRWVDLILSEKRKVGN